MLSDDHHAHGSLESFQPKAPPAPARPGAAVVSVQRIESGSALQALEPEWRRLEESAGVPLPFVTFDWAAAWWEHLREVRLGVRDRLCARAFRSPSGELVGIAPLLTTHRPGYGLVASRQLQFLGSDPNITEVRAMPVAPGRQAAVNAALLDEIEGSADSWDWMVISGRADDPDFEGALRARFSRVDHLRDIPGYYLPLPATWPEFKSRLGRNIKESLRRCYNAPKRDGIVPHLEVLTARADVAPALDDFFRLHRARASCDDTIHHNDVFDSPAAKAFLADVCERFAARGAFRMFRLMVGGAVVANRIGFVLGDSLYLYYSGFEPAFGRYSVMTTVVAEAIQYAIANGFRVVHLSTGNDVSKTRWNPLERRHREWLVISPSFRGWVAHHLAQQARSWLDRTRLAGWFTRRGGRRPDGAAEKEHEPPVLS